MTVERDAQPLLKTTPLSIAGIPAILWGEPSPRLILAVHGNQSSKEDDVIVRLARAAAARGEQVLSFDLPAHGERKAKEAVCHVRQAVPELQAILHHAQERSAHVSLFACSMGAYFSLLAFSEANSSAAFSCRRWSIWRALSTT